jgi:hypothetical protein
LKKKKRRQALALAQDQHLIADAIDMLHAVDQYDYTYLWNWMGVPIIPTSCRHNHEARGDMGNKT